MSVDVRGQLSGVSSLTLNDQPQTFSLSLRQASLPFSDPQDFDDFFLKKKKIVKIIARSETFWDAKKIFMFSYWMNLFEKSIIQIRSDNRSEDCKRSTSGHEATQRTNKYVKDSQK